MPLLQFNEAQIQAIQHNKGPCMVIAGPGSGKTTVLTHRVRYLIDRCGVNPSDILVITFTKAAAEQMKLKLHIIILHAALLSHRYSMNS